MILAPMLRNPRAIHTDQVTDVPWGQYRYAASSSYSDTLSAYNTCEEGDVLVLYPGTPNWGTNTLDVTKGIYIMGPGSHGLVITSTAGYSAISITPGSNKRTRVSGVDFYSGTYTLRVNGSYNGSFCWTNLRIDHCDFESCTTGLRVDGWTESLADHNHFKNCNRGILFEGEENGVDSWARDIVAGTSHAFFVEDNIFELTSSAPFELNETIYMDSGVRVVVRHNTWDCTTYAYPACVIDSHPNYLSSNYNGYNRYGTGGADGRRGQPLVEYYENTFNYTWSYRVIYIRGGASLIHHNNFNFTGSSTEVVFSDDEVWSSTHSPHRTTWPAQDQIANTYIWGNKRNGVSGVSVGNNQPEDDTFIQEGRDYFLYEPASSGGYTYYTGTRRGGSQTYPTNGGYAFPGGAFTDGGDTAFSSSGASVFYPYTPYAYPHPLNN